MEGAWRQAIEYRDQMRENIRRLMLESEADSEKYHRGMLLVSEQIQDAVCELGNRKQALIVNKGILRNLRKPPSYTHPQSEFSTKSQVQKIINQSNFATKIIKENNKRIWLKIQDYQNKIIEKQPAVTILKEQQEKMKEELLQKVEKNKEIQKVSLELKEKHISTRMKINDIIDLKADSKKEKVSLHSSRILFQKQLENTRNELEQKLDRKSDIVFLIKERQMQIEYQEGQLEKQLQKLLKEKRHHQQNKAAVGNLQDYIELLDEQNKILGELTQKCKILKQETSILYDREKKRSNVGNSGKIIKNQNYLFSKQKGPLEELHNFANNAQWTNKHHQNSKYWYEEPSNTTYGF